MQQRTPELVRQRRVAPRQRSPDGIAAPERLLGDDKRIEPLVTERPALPAPRLRCRPLSVVGVGMFVVHHASSAGVKTGRPFAPLPAQVP